jgi:membrane protease YdiL (CAAX protease family)
VPLFAETTAALWFVATVTSLGWLRAGGDWRSLGFAFLPGWGAVAAWSVAALATAFLWYQWRTVVRSPEARDRYATQVNEAKGFDWVRPTTPREYRLFRWMAVTVGITEEVIFRGFLIGVLASWMPLWVAALAALFVFVGAHVYQGLSGMLRILPVSAVLTLLFLISGSLLPGILLHAVVDLVGGAILWEVRDRRVPAGEAPGENRARPAS